MSEGTKALKKLTEYLTGDCNDNVYEWLSEIEKELKEYEETDNQLNDLFDKFEINNRNDLLKKLRELEERREMMKRFNEACVPMVLDNKTEKKLKALEIIKETPIFAWYVTIYKDAYELVADRKGFRVDESVEEIQEKFDLLKEVLL